MLPEKIINEIEFGRIKDPCPPQFARMSVAKSKNKKGGLRLFCAILSVVLSLSSITFMGSEFAAKCIENADGIFGFMLGSNFPNFSPPDTPAGIISPEDMTTPEDETTAPPSESAPPPEESASPELDASPETPDESLPSEETPEKEPTIYDFDYSLIPEGESPIIPIDLCAGELGKFYISNETPYIPDLEALSGSDESVAAWKEFYTDKDPLVLIIHTHATESYSEEGALSYTKGELDTRTDDCSKNVVAVGSVMAKVFRENGIPTLHCTILHDFASYKDSYNRSAATIKEYLKKYPSIKYVFDVHRDSLVREDGEKLRPITEIDGKPAAQVMSVVGTDYKGAAHQNWETNLSLAARLQSLLDEKYTSFARPIYLRGASFNQQYTAGSLLLEIGSCGNSLSEAKFAGEIVAKELSQIIKGN